MPKLSTVFRVVLAGAVAVFPIVYAHEIETRRLVFFLGFCALAVSVAGIEIYFDWKTSTERDAMRHKLEEEIKQERNRLEIQQAYGVTIARLIGLLEPVIGIIGKVAVFSNEQKQSAVTSLNDASSELLKAACAAVKAYYKEHRGLRVSASLMLAHPMDKCDGELRSRVNKDFIEYGREDLSSYWVVLDMTLIIGDGVAQFPQIALPVEDPSRPLGKRKLLPGAPMAFAMNVDQFIADTAVLAEHAGQDLAADVLENQRKYFEGQAIGSMVCLVLRQETDPIGVLNIHSEAHGLFDPSQDVLVRSIEHYRACLQYVMVGQRELRGLAS